MFLSLILCPLAHSLALILQSAIHEHTAVFLMSPPDMSQRHLTPSLPSPTPPQANLPSVFLFSQIAPLCTGCHPGELPHTLQSVSQILSDRPFKHLSFIYLFHYHKHLCLWVSVRISLCLLKSFNGFPLLLRVKARIPNVVLLDWAPHTFSSLIFWVLDTVAFSLSNIRRSFHLRPIPLPLSVTWQRFSLPTATLARSAPRHMVGIQNFDIKQRPHSWWQRQNSDSGMTQSHLWLCGTVSYTADVGTASASLHFITLLPRVLRAAWLHDNAVTLWEHRNQSFA